MNNKPDSDCALCRITMESVHFNLKKNHSKYSQTPLILIIENITKNFFTTHFEICVQCFNLLNELDAIQMRQVEIENQLRKFVEDNKCNTTEEQTNDANSVTVSKRTSAIESNVIHEVVRLEGKLLIDVESANTGGVTVKADVTKKCNDIKPHKCHCSKEFRTAKELQNHESSHDNQRAFVCEICGRSYKHKSAFNIHMDIHSGINPFTCVYCNKSFTQKGALVRHLPIHTGEKPYQCDQCGKRFVHHTSFNVHRLSHTGLKSFKCTLCGLALMSTSHLRRHMRMHTGERKFVCGTCGKRFAEKYNLAVHEKLHTNPGSGMSQKRKYSCQICGVSFERKVKLEEHLLKEHQMMRSVLENGQVLKQEVLKN